MTVVLSIAFIIYSLFIAGSMIYRIRNKTFDTNVKEMAIAFACISILSLNLKIDIIIKAIALGVVFILFCYGSTIKKK
ncbi:hypothetical protein M5X00_06755 [Paenibacillus alvei]|uniref:Uncharacterized protein n=1 Tax=Paenibacillus alvei TaxID=44250 RepID=A0ABT4GWP1_PAEAL|nr:hypothetical protein [Paenibacillus alvei]MCY7484539.1 hypothetical protein [Paenibacillus alvei]MCY9541284.1 hypothetical protein [Paenibacillus alvei]MCY9705047.1 hypothetical protein [Paenibacillus alvei]MCY9734723.1 hypothetical protein [Paenibacillus alvei]MCY9753954.1 hypothetical protein [Paenibacillus alvei]